MAISRYRLNDNPVGTALKADPNNYFGFLVTPQHSGVAGVTTPIPKEGQRCRAVTGLTGTYTTDLVQDSLFPLYSYGFLDFYFYNSSAANTDWRIYVLDGYNDISSESTFQYAYIKQSTNEVFIAQYDGFGVFTETSLGANNIPRDKWSRIVVNIGIDYGGGFWGFMNKVSVFTGTNINGLVPDYSNTTDTGFTTADFGINIGQTGGEAVSQVGGFIDDIIISDSVIVRKKPFIIG